MMMMNFTAITTTAATNSNFIRSTTVDPYAIVGVSQVSLVIESTFLILVSTVAFTANTSLWLVVLTTRDLRTESNVLILCLSLADLLVAVLGAPITVSSIISSRWLFSRDMCTFVGYMNMLTFVASVQSLGVISLNRYFKICRPGKYLDIYTFRNVGFMFLGVWLYSGLLSTPPLIGWASYDFLPLASICFCDWEKSPSYAVFMILMCFCVPCFAMILCYVAIIKAFLRSRRALMAFANSVRSTPTSSKPSTVHAHNITRGSKLRNQTTTNRRPPGTTLDHRIRVRDRTSASNLVGITENPVDFERPVKQVVEHSTKETNWSDLQGQPPGSQLDNVKSSNSVNEDDFNRKELRPFIEGFTFSSSENNKEIKLKENPNSSLLLRQRFVPEKKVDYEFTDNASKNDKNCRGTNHDNMYDANAAKPEQNATVAVMVTTGADSDYDTPFRNSGDPSELASVMVNYSPEYSFLLKNKSKITSPIGRSHSYTDCREHFSTEYGTVHSAGVQYNRSFSEIPGSYQSPKCAAALLTVGSPITVQTATGQRDCFEQAVDRSLLNEVYSSNNSVKTLKRPLLSKPMLLSSVDSLNPFQSYTPSSASTSLASSDLSSSSSHQQIPLNLFQYSSQHSPTSQYKPSATTANSLRPSKSEEMISKRSTAGASDSDSNLNNTVSRERQHSLSKVSKRLSVSSPALASAATTTTKTKTQKVLHSQKRAREEFQLAASLLVVILIFIICWFPYCISMFVSITSTSNHALDITSLLLGYMNSCVNPIVYGVMNRRFKMGYRKMYVKLLRISRWPRKSKIVPLNTNSKSNSSIT